MVKAIVALVQIHRNMNCYFYPTKEVDDIWSIMKLSELIKSIGMAHKHVYNYFIIKHDRMIHTVLMKNKLELWIYKTTYFACYMEIYIIYA
jgi:hypothetical protein